MKERDMGIMVVVVVDIQGGVVPLLIKDAVDDTLTLGPDLGPFHLVSIEFITSLSDRRIGTVLVRKYLVGLNYRS